MLKSHMGMRDDEKYIGCHVRHGDKSCEICSRHSWQEYAHLIAHASVNSGTTRVFLASDDEDAFYNLPALLPHITFYHIPSQFFPIAMYVCIPSVPSLMYKNEGPVSNAGMVKTL